MQYIKSYLHCSAILIPFILFLGYSQNYSQMDLNQCLKNDSQINSFVLNHFYEITDNHKNPIFPYKVEYANNNLQFTFCDIPVEKSWAYKNGNFFTFYLIVAESSNVVEKITSFYGKHYMEGGYQIDKAPSTNTYFWHLDKLNIVLRRHLSENLIPIQKKKLMIILGNVRYADLFDS